MTNNDWWSKKLSGNQTPRQAPPIAPNPQVPYMPPPQQPNVQVNYDPQQDQLVTRAVSARNNDRCPGCGSGNYFAPQGTQRMRCYDCGYPVVQSGTGAGSTGSSSNVGAPIPAKQVGQGGGFNPNIIVDRIG